MTAIHQSRAIADAAVEKLRVFAQPQRLMILSYLLGGERQVADIEAATGVTQPALSQQLAALRLAPGDLGVPVAADRVERDIDAVKPGFPEGCRHLGERSPVGGHRKVEHAIEPSTKCLRQLLTL